MHNIHGFTFSMTVPGGSTLTGQPDTALVFHLASTTACNWLICFLLYWPFPLNINSAKAETLPAPVHYRIIPRTMPSTQECSVKGHLLNIENYPSYKEKYSNYLSCEISPLRQNHLDYFGVFPSNIFVEKIRKCLKWRILLYYLSYTTEYSSGCYTFFENKDWWRDIIKPFSYYKWNCNAYSY